MLCRAYVLSCVRLFVTLWTVARQALLSVGFSRQEYWSRLPFPSPGDLPDPGIEPPSPVSPALQVNFIPAIKEARGCQVNMTLLLTLRMCSVQLLSRVRLFATLWTVARQASLSVECCREEYWSGLPSPPPGDIPDPGIEPTSPVSPALQVNSLPIEPSGRQVDS